MLFGAQRNLAEDEMIRTLIEVLGCLAPQNKEWLIQMIVRRLTLAEQHQHGTAVDASCASWLLR